MGPVSTLRLPATYHKHKKGFRIIVLHFVSFCAIMLKMRCLLGAILWICCAVCRECAFGFSAPRPIKSTTHHLVSAATRDGEYNDGDPTAAPCSRREWTRSAFSSLIATTIGSSVVGSDNPEPAAAAAAAASFSSSGGGEYTIWKTGRAPIVPGQKPRDKDDVKGTRKDPNFLRSVADCKGKCENTPGPDGLARSSTECLSACQDICCTTYEQCTFAIVPR